MWITASAWFGMPKFRRHGGVHPKTTIKIMKNNAEMIWFISFWLFECP